MFDEFFGNSAELLDEEYGPLRARVVLHRACSTTGAGCRRAWRGSRWPSERGAEDPRRHRGGLGSARSAQVLARSGRDVGPRPGLGRRDASAIAPDYRGKSTDGLISLAMLRPDCARLRACGGQDYVSRARPRGARAASRRRCTTRSVPFPGIEPMRYLDSPASVPVFARPRRRRSRACGRPDPHHPRDHVRPGVGLGGGRAGDAAGCRCSACAARPAAGRAQAL